MGFRWNEPRPHTNDVCSFSRAFNASIKTQNFLQMKSSSGASTLNPLQKQRMGNSNPWLHCHFKAPTCIICAVQKKNKKMHQWQIFSKLSHQDRLVMQTWRENVRSLLQISSLGPLLAPLCSSKNLNSHDVCEFPKDRMNFHQIVSLSEPHQSFCLIHLD